MLFSVSVMYAQNDAQSGQQESKEHMTLHASTTFGQDYFSNNFFINTFGADYSKQLNDKTTLYLGANIFNVNTSKELADFAPRNKHTGSMYVGMSYKANDNLIVSGDIFYNGIYNMIGGDFDMKFMFGEHSFFEISATFSRQLSPAGYHYPVPYGYDNIFNPFIFGY